MCVLYERLAFTSDHALRNPLRTLRSFKVTSRWLHKPSLNGCILSCIEQIELSHISHRTYINRIQSNKWSYIEHIDRVVFESRLSASKTLIFPSRVLNVRRCCAGTGSVTIVSRGWCCWCWQFYKCVTRVVFNPQACQADNSLPLAQRALQILSTRVWKILNRNWLPFGVPLKPMWRAQCRPLPTSGTSHCSQSTNETCLYVIKDEELQPILV